MINYPVNLPSLKENFPPGFEPCQLLLELGDWLSRRPWGSVGCFTFGSRRFSDHWIENGLDLHPYFAFFMRDPTGGEVGYWLHNGPTTPSPPIVLIGSEGQLRVLGDTLEGFIGRLADRSVDASDLGERCDEVEDAGPELANWLTTRVVPSSETWQPYPDLTRWIDRWSKQQQARDEQNLPLREIAHRLRKYLKPDAEPWERAFFDVLLVGTQFNVWRRHYGVLPMPVNEVAALEPLFRALREQRAREVPERGAWFSAWVTVGAEGVANLSCNFMEQPKFLDQRPVIPARDYALDLRNFPRSQHWLPTWLEP
jgi:hypothetical protein